MQTLKISILAAVSAMIFSGTALADTRPGKPAERSYDETVKLMKLGKYVRCSFSKDFVLQTKKGLSTPDSKLYSKVVLFDSLPLEASSSSDFATYGLSWENKEFKFYAFMNSQNGEIRIFDNKKGLSAESSLDLSDFGKEEPYIGTARLIQKEDLLVTSPEDETKKVPGERFTYLTGSCQFLERWVP